MKLLSGIGWVLFLLIRGLALWVLLPFSVLAWLLIHSWAQRASVGQAICWYDQNFNLLLAKGLLWPLLATEIKGGKFVRLSQMGSLSTYKIRWLMTMV